MAYKQFALDERTPVTVYKRRTSRGLRLSIGSRGEVRVSQPAWLPYSAGVRFARSRLAWIQRHVDQQPTRQLVAGQAIGKAHHLRFVTDSGLSKPHSRVLASEVMVTMPPSLTAADAEVQRLAEAAGIRALRRQAEELLPQRLSALAQARGYQYRGVAVKRLKGRWGSCDQQQNIVLNLYLMQLPWECIDYVLIHELVHTKVLRHSADFWQVMGQELPELKRLRAEMRAYQPVLHGPTAAAVA